jgi:AbrB family looped-hinge helix DNA binding protein
MKQTPVKIGEGGRIVLPADYRKALGLDIGDELILHLEHGKMMLLTKPQAIQYVQEKMAAYSTKGRVLSEEVIEERKREDRDE